MEEGLLKFLQRSLAEPVPCRHSGLGLNAFSQPLHGRLSVGHTSVRNFAKCSVGESAEVCPGAIQERRWHPLLLFVA